MGCTKVQFSPAAEIDKMQVSSPGELYGLPSVARLAGVNFLNPKAGIMFNACNRVKCYYASLDGVGLRAINTRSALVLESMPPSKEKLIYRF
jgi:hypothetical protein